MDIVNKLQNMQRAARRLEGAAAEFNMAREAAKATGLEFHVVETWPGTVRFAGEDDSRYLHAAGKIEIRKQGYWISLDKGQEIIDG